MLRWPRNFYALLRGFGEGQHQVDAKTHVRWLCVVEVATWPLARLWAMIFGPLLALSIYRGDAIGRTNYAVLFAVPVLGSASFYVVGLLPVVFLAMISVVVLPLLYNKTPSLPS